MAASSQRARAASAAQAAAGGSPSSEARRGAPPASSSQTARPGARFDIGSHHFWRAHLTYLLTEAGAANPGTAADVLLAAMTAEQIDHWVRRENRDHRRVAADLRQLAARWCGPDPPRGR